MPMPVSVTSKRSSRVPPHVSAAAFCMISFTAASKVHPVVPSLLTVHTPSSVWVVTMSSASPGAVGTVPENRWRKNPSGPCSVLLNPGPLWQDCASAPDSL